jgi:hypothetical protein
MNDEGTHYHVIVFYCHYCCRSQSRFFDSDVQRPNPKAIPNHIFAKQRFSFGIVCSLLFQVCGMFESPVLCTVSEVPGKLNSFEEAEAFAKITKEGTCFE